MLLSKAVDGYVIASLADGYSQLTIRGYRSAIGIMINYLGDKDIQSVTTEDLRGFMHYLVTQYKPRRFNNHNIEKLSTASHHRYWKAMRSFFKWADNNLGTGRPDEPIKMPSWESKEVVPFSEDEVVKLLRGCEYTEVDDGKRKPYRIHRPNAIRDKAIILVLLDTGIRVGELTRLRVKDANLENGELYVRPFHVRKTHSRTTVLGKSARKALWRYLVNRESVRPDDLLFVTNEDKPMTTQAVLKMCKRLERSVGVKNVHPHRFRHTFAIQYLRNSGDIFTLQRLLGHKRLDVVNRYLHIVKDDLKSAHQRASPVDNWKLL